MEGHKHIHVHLHVHLHLHLHLFLHIHIYICIYTCTFAFACACARGREEGREGRGVVLGGSVGRWVGENVLVCVSVVLVFVSVVSLCWCFLKIPEIEQPYQVKRMIGGLRNVLFSTCSQTSNG